MITLTEGVNAARRPYSIPCGGIVVDYTVGE